jgi:hypothetical protein
VDHTNPRGRRFGTDFVSAHKEKYGDRSPERRALTYAIAVENEFEPWRQWLDEQLALLPVGDATALSRKIWLDKDFWTVIFELATGAALRAAGHTVAYERRWNGLGPDWTVLGEDGKPLCFVEVYTDNPTDGTFAKMKAWHSLVERVRQIPVGVVLQVAPGSPVGPPDAGTAKTIARELREQLLEGTTQATFSSCEYTFLVMGDSRRGGMQLASPWGTRACLNSPSSIAGIVDTSRLVCQVEAKVRKYKALAEVYEVPLVVAVGAHKFTGVSLSSVDNLISGSEAPVVNIQFGAGDGPVTSGPMTWGPVAPWTMPEALSELLWVSNEFPFPLTRRPNPTALRPQSFGLGL